MFPSPASSRCTPVGYGAVPELPTPCAHVQIYARGRDMKLSDNRPMDLVAGSQSVWDVRPHGWHKFEHSGRILQKDLIGYNNNFKSKFHEKNSILPQKNEHLDIFQITKRKMLIDRRLVTCHVFDCICPHSTLSQSCTTLCNSVHSAVDHIF